MALQKPFGNIPCNKNKAHTGKISREEAKQKIELFDLEMRAKYDKQLSAAVFEALKAGIEVPHPEINFALRKGKAMFFEVNRIDFERFVYYCIDHISPKKQIVVAKAMLSLGKQVENWHVVYWGRYLTAQAKLMME